jgi:hypothetical protein
MSTSLTLTDIEKMDRKDVIAALEFIAKKIGFDAGTTAVSAPTTIAPEDNPETGVQLPPVVPVVAPAPTAAQAAFAPAATAVPAAPVAAPTGIETDKNGLPWDGRIHSSARSKVADGSWKMRRGVDDEFVKGIENELRQTMGLPTLAVAASPLTPPPAAVFAQPAAPVVAPAPVVVAPPVEVPAPPVASIAPVVAAPVASAVTPMNFAKLMSLITAAFAAKTLDQATINAAVQAAGLPSLPMLAARPDLVATVADKLGLVA